MIDELAYAAEMDPLPVPAPEHRPRDQNAWRDALVAVGQAGELEAAGRRLEPLADANVVHGRGIALGTLRRLAGAASWSTSR